MHSAHEGEEEGDGVMEREELRAGQSDDRWRRQHEIDNNPEPCC